MVDMSRYNKLRINPDRYNYDLATNLPLRRTFWRIADKTVLFDNKTYCILAIDIENFHLINKWYGRETGDELLIEIGEALKSIDAGYGTISGYMGGDNFCVISGYLLWSSSYFIYLRRQMLYPFGAVRFYRNCCVSQRRYSYAWKGIPSVWLW